jgi:uncharacterized OB-fold protein
LEEFFAFLRRGDFRIPICTSCKKKVWPPSRNCKSCFRKTELKSVIKEGTLLEFTTSYIGNTEVIFGAVEIYGIRLMGCLTPTTKEFQKGMKVRMTGCGINTEGATFYNFEG